MGRLGCNGGDWSVTGGKLKIEPKAIFNKKRKIKCLLYLADSLKSQLKPLNGFMNPVCSLCISLNVRSPLIPGNVSAVQVRLCFCDMAM